MADEDLEQLEEVAAEPAAVTSDGISVQKHSLSERIAFDKYRRSVGSANSPATSFTRMKIVPPGTA